MSSIARRGPRGAQTDFVRSAAQRPREVRALIAGVLVSRAASFGYPLITFRLDGLGLESDAGLVLAAFAAGWGTGAMVSGWVSDRLGPRTATVTVMMLSTAALPMLGTTSFLPAIVVCAVLAGGSYDALRPVFITGLSALVDDARDRAHHITNWHRAINLGSAAAGVAIIAFTPTTAGLRVLFGVNALACSLVAVLAILVLPTGRFPGQAAARGGYGTALADRRLWLLCGSTLGGLICMIAIFSGLPLLFTHAGLSSRDYGFAQMCGTGAVPLLTSAMRPWLARRASCRRSPTGLLAAGSILLGAAMGLAALQQTTLTITAAVLVSLPGEVALIVAAGDILHRITPTPDQYGRYGAVWTGSGAIAAITTPLLISACLTGGGRTAVAWALLLAGLCPALLCLPLAGAMRRHRAPRRYLSPRSR